MHLPKMYPVNLCPKSNPEKHPHLTFNPKCTSSKRTSRIFALKSDPEKRPHLNLNPKRISPKRTPRIFAPKCYLDKRYRPTLSSKSNPEKRTCLTLDPKCYPDERTRLNLDKEGNRRVRVPELFREFRAASIFAHPTLGRRAFPSFVVCLKWAEVYGLRRGRAA